jgi:hypothetical protein
MVNKFQNTLDAVSARGELATYMHVDYKYHHPDWVGIRDAMAGERRVKEKGALYLPALDVEYGTSFEVYKSRACFVNMVGRTVVGMVGTIFRRPVKVEGIDRKYLQNVTVNGLDFNLFAKKLALEICSVGRIGVLVDMRDEKPYMTEYIAENILSWRTSMVNGREELSYVLLREIADETPILNGDQAVSPPGGYYQTGSLTARYRVLVLENGVYKQRLYQVDSTESNPSFVGRDYTEIIPTRNGKPFDFIPMVIMGPLSPTPEVQRSPILDIVVLNFAHYRTSAQLEHGRFYTALPVYYVPTAPGQESADYHVGPSVVWEVPPDSKPGILEYYGQGLATLASSLTEKEEHIAQLGGRIMGIRPQATAESDNIYRIKQANEMSILLNITESMALGLEKVLRWYFDWQRISTTNMKVKINQDFKALQIAARELRALALLYQEGILPIQAVYESLQAAEFIPEEWTVEEFTEMLTNMENFPNQPDVEAKSEGYANAQARQQREQMDEQLDVQLELNDLTFDQTKVTTQMEHENAIELEKIKSANKIKEQKAAPKPKPAAKPAAKKPAPKA